jgi:hypothetical protein
MATEEKMQENRKSSFQSVDFVFFCGCIFNKLESRIENMIDEYDSKLA